MVVSVLVLVGFAVFSFRGTAQLGSYISFLGSLSLFIPPYRQLHRNRHHSRSIEYQSTDPEQQKLNMEVEEKRRIEFLAYSREDFIFALLGLFLTVLGVLLTIIASPDSAT